MKRILLTLCATIMTIASAWAQVQLTKVTADGKTILVHVPVAGTFAPTITDNPVISPESSATITDLKAAENVIVTGLLANSDVQELVHLIGGTYRNNGHNRGPIDTNCKSMDMGGATMTEAITTSNGKCSLVPANENKYLSAAESIVLPKPAEGYTVLPANMDKLFADTYDCSLNGLKSLTIPEGWTEVSDCFSTYDGNCNTAFQSLTTLSFPHSLTKIGAYAFAGLDVTVLNMPLNIDRIGAYAFDRARQLQDVYFFGPAPTFVDVHAFAGKNQMVNNTVEDNRYNNIVDPETDRFNYKNDGVLATIMHYPRDYKAQYLDTTREYLRRTDGNLYHKGNSDNMYGLPLWTPTLVQSMLSKVNADGVPEAQPHETVNYGVKDRFYGLDMIWPSQEQMTMAYALAHCGYKWTGERLDTETQYDPNATYGNGGIDRRGLYQFIIFMGNSVTNFTYEQDKWYTISLPFNMTVEEIKKIFGPDTQVCRFSKVIRETDEGKKRIRLEFRKSVMGDRTEPEFDGTYYDCAHDHDDETEYKGFHTGIIHHFPYMIKPSGIVYDDPSIKIDANGKRHFDGIGFDRIPGTLHNDDVIWQNEAGQPGNFAYSFCPMLVENRIKINSYILVNRIKNGEEVHEYVFYKGKYEGGKYVSSGLVNQNTAYVQLFDNADGTADLDAFFSATTNAAQVPVNASVFGDDEEASGVGEVVILCGGDKPGDNKVYTINGILVSGENLPAGLYIKNGKTFMVK